MLAQGCSLEEIGRRVGRHPSTVSYWLKKHDLRALLTEKHAPKGGISRERLADLVEAGSSVREIAEAEGVSAATVRHWLKRHGMKTRRAREPRSALAGERFVANCATHGETTFEIRPDGARRCLKCRSEAVARRRRLVKSILVEEFGGRCQICGYDRYSGALEFHHVDPATKEFSLGHAGVTRSLERARAEARKCVLLCATCHAEVEGGMASVATIASHPG